MGAAISDTYTQPGKILLKRSTIELEGDFAIDSTVVCKETRG